MDKKLSRFLPLLSLFCFSHLAIAAEAPTAVSTVRDFYVKLLKYQANTGEPEPSITLSQSLAAEIEKNRQLCAKYADGVCGFGADGDPYLDAQDYEDNLSAEKCRLTVTETKDHLVAAKFNLFPSEPTDPYAVRTVTYKMIQENGAWVVDDIFYERSTSARKMMADENAFNLTQKPLQ